MVLKHNTERPISGKTEGENSEREQCQRRGRRKRGGRRDDF